MSTDQGQGGGTGRGSLRLAPVVDDEIEHPSSRLPRQFVNFTFYRARPEWRLLDQRERDLGKQELINTVEEFRRDLLIHTYSLVGLRTNAELMMWRIGYSLDPFQEMSARLNATVTERATAPRPTRPMTAGPPATRRQERSSYQPR